MGERGTFNIHDTFLGITEPNCERTAFANPTLMLLLNTRIRKMRSRGWVIRKDGETHRSIRHFYRRGHHRHLFVTIKAGGRCLDFNFNIHGNKYGNQRFDEMPASLQRQSAAEITRLVRVLLRLGYSPTRHRGQHLVLDPNRLGATVLALMRGVALSPLDHFNANWNFAHDWDRGHRWERGDDGWPVPSEYNTYRGAAADRDGGALRPGRTVFFRPTYGPRGRLLRGACYPWMNGRWMVDTGVGRFYVHGSEMFACARPDLEPRRVVPGQIKRLEKELVAATKIRDFGRVSVLAGVLQMAAHRATPAQHATQQGT